jgi:hypothetical protein
MSNPLLSLLNNTTKKKNQYDDGTVWTNPTTTSSPFDYNGFNSRFNSFIGADTPTDPLEGARNQVQYYTNELNDMGQTPVAPDTIDNKKSLGSSALRLLEQVTAPIASLGNALSGGVTSYIDNLGKKTAELEQSTGKDLSPIERATIALGVLTNTKMQDNIKAQSAIDAVKSGGETIANVFDESHRNNIVDFGKMLDVLKQNPESAVSGTANALETTANPVYHISKALGVNEDNARQFGNIGFDLGASVLTGGLTDIQDAGKALKYIRNSDRIDNVASKLSTKTAQDLAEKANNFDEYASVMKSYNPTFTDAELKAMHSNAVTDYADNLLNKTIDTLGGMSDFKGVKLAGQTILSKDTLKSLSENKITNALTQVGLGVLSPVSAIANNPIADKIGSKLDGVEGVDNLKDGFNKLFSFGKNNDSVISARKDPSRALEYMNEKIIKNVKQRDKVAEVMRAVDDVKTMMNDGVDSKKISSIMEEPVTEKTVEQMNVKDVLNPEYIKAVYSANNEKLNALNKKFRTQLKDYKSAVKVAEKNGYSATDILQMKHFINNAEQKLNMIENTPHLKSLSFYKQLVSNGVEDKTARAFAGEGNNINSFFDKVVKGDTSSVKKMLSNYYEKMNIPVPEDSELNKIAEKIKLSSDNVMKTIETDAPELAKYYVSTKGHKLADYFDKGSNAELEYLKKFGSYQPFKKDDVRDLNTLDKLEKKSNRYRNEIKPEFEKLGIKLDATHDKHYDTASAKDIDNLANTLKAKKMYQESSSSVSAKMQNMRDFINNNKGTRILKDTADYKDNNLTNMLLDSATARRKRVNNNADVPVLKYNDKFAMDSADGIKIAKYKKPYELQESTMNVKDIKKQSDKDLIEKVATGLEQTHANTVMDMSKEDLRKNLSYLTKDELSTIQDHITNSRLEPLKKQFNTEDFSHEVALDNVSAMGKNRDNWNETLQKDFARDGEQVKEEVNNVNNYSNKTLNAIRDSIDSKQYNTVKTFKDLSVSDLRESLMYDVDKRGKLSQETIDHINKMTRTELELANTRINIKYRNEVQKDYKVSKGQIDAIATLMRHNGSTFTDLVKKGVFKKSLITDFKYHDWNSVQADLFFKSMNLGDNLRFINQKDPQTLREIMKLSDNFKNVDFGIVKYVADKAEELGIKDSKLKTTPLNKLLSDSVFDNLSLAEKKNFLTFDTPTGKINVSDNIDSTALGKITIDDFNDLNNVAKSTDRFYTDNLGAEGLQKDKNIALDINGKNVSATTSHELGHVVGENIDNKSSRVAGSIKKLITTLPEDKKNTLSELINKLGVNNSTTKLIDKGYLDTYIKESKKVSQRQYSKETFATLSSLFNNSDINIRNKAKELLGEDNYKKWTETISKMPVSEYKQAEDFVYKTLGDEVGDKLNRTRTIVSNLNIDLNKFETNKQIYDKINNLKDELFPKAEFNEALSEYSNVTDEVIKRFELANSGLAEQIQRKIPKYKKMNEYAEKVIRIDNTGTLTDAEKSAIEKLQKEFKHIALEEGIYNSEADAHKYLFINIIY